jgi:hypothetical protein
MRCADCEHYISYTEEGDDGSCCKLERQGKECSEE